MNPLKIPAAIALRALHLFREIFLDPMPLRDFSDYDAYWEQRGPQQSQYRFHWIADRLPPTGRLLDIGCGDGTFLELVRTRRPDLTTYGLDGSAAAIRKLRARGLKGNVMDLARPDLSRSDDFEIVTAMELLEHLAEPELVMAELQKSAVQTLYITIPNMGFLGNRLRLALGGKTPLTAVMFHMKEHLRFWTVRDFKHWARCCGFEVVEYAGQNGIFGLWKMAPSLFARQMVYVLRKRDGR